jgi:hypothetical protein
VNKQLLYILTSSLLFLSYTHEALSQSIQTVYLTKGDTSTNMYVLVSPSDSIKETGFMFLIPGFNERPGDVLVQTKLPAYAAQHGILTIIPILTTGVTSFAIDDSTQSSLKKMIEYCVQTYHLKGLDFYIGGFSLGGTCAIKYAELAIKDSYSIKPRAVFAIDPPLDFERFYNSAVRNLRLMKGIYANPELIYMTERIKDKFGGTPETALVNYYKYSPYSFSDTSQSAVKLLKYTPISIYAEPDIEWWLNNYGFDYTNINSIDGAAMINELHLLGDMKSRFVVTHNKGYRMPRKIKNPHSWSILAPNDLISWFGMINSHPVK